MYGILHIAKKFLTAMKTVAATWFGYGIAVLRNQPAVKRITSIIERPLSCEHLSFFPVDRRCPTFEPVNLKMCILRVHSKQNKMANTSKISWIAIAAVSALAAILLVWIFFPQILKQMVTATIALFAFLFGLIFRKKK